MKKKFFAIILAFMLNLSILSGCSVGGSSQNSNDAMPDYSEAKGQLGFMSYSVPLPTEEQFKLYKEAGLRTMLMDGEYLGFYQGLFSKRDGVDLDLLEEFFKLAEEYGVNILDRGMDMDNIMTNAKRQSLYTKYPNAFKGFFIGDEPSTDEIDDTLIGEDNRIINWINENYPNAVYTTTLHPSWAPEKETGGYEKESMPQYYRYMVDNVLKAVKGKGQKILCSDDYPCKRYGYDGDNFLKTLLYMSIAVGTDDTITKQMCLNCSTFREVNEMPGVAARPENEWFGAYEKEVTEMEIRMPAITSLAFGFKSFLYFMYGPFPHSDEAVIEREIIDCNGNQITKNKSPIDYDGPDSVKKTEYYDYIKKTNLELERFEKCFTSFKWYGAHMIAQSGIYDDVANRINIEYDDYLETKFKNLSSYKATGDADVVIGYFKQKNKSSREGYFVSNFCGYTDMKYKTSTKGIPNNASSYEYNKNAEVTLKFNDFDRVYIVKNGETITDQKLVKHALKQELKPGDYMFVIPY